MSPSDSTKIHYYCNLEVQSLPTIFTIGIVHSSLCRQSRCLPFCVYVVGMKGKRAGADVVEKERDNGGESERACVLERNRERE